MLGWVLSVCPVCCVACTGEVQSRTDPVCLHAVAGMLPLTDEDALHISSELRSRRSTARKRNLKPSKPLKAYPNVSSYCTASTDAEVKRTALQQTLQVLELLPSNSAYAKHRRATVQKALDLLNAERYRNSERPAIMCAVASVSNGAPQECRAGL